MWSKTQRRTGILAIATMLLFAIPGCKKEETAPAPAKDPLTSSKYYSFKDDMRQLWSDHMQWTYSTVDAYYHDQNGLQAQLDRLLQNQKDIGDAIRPYYGDAAGDTLSALLTTHIQQAVPVLESAKNNDQPALDKALADWKANAKDIAHFLNSANPENWPLATMEHAMEHHIDQTTTYAVDLLKGDYTNAVKHYGEAYDHMFGTADLLAKGIALQFPDKF